MKNIPINFAVFILIVLNFVGILGISIPQSREFFLQFSPLNLLISLALILQHQTNKNKAFVFVCLFVTLFGIGIEMIGVHTGLIFGNYEYKTTLGLKVNEVPPMIGVNWLLCVLSVGSLLNYTHLTKPIKIALGSILLVALDILIEPVAIQLHFWQWQNNSIPIQNYLAWGIVSAIMFIVYYAFEFEKNNFVAAWQFVLFVLFFGILNFTLGY